MRDKIQHIITTLKSVLEGEPWYGQPVMKMLQDVNEEIVYNKPNNNSHSLIELLYHLNTWAEFTLNRMEKRSKENSADFEKLDWRQIDPAEHTWQKGIAQFKVTHDLIIELLETKDDAFLSEKVDERKYDFGALLEGIIHHDIYHIGQVAYVKKLLS
jgi:uncharacterized damage-inducible protein DinB